MTFSNSAYYTSNPIPRINSSALLFLHDTRAHRVIKSQLPIFDVVFKVHVDRVRRELIDRLRQTQIVRRHEPNSA